MRFMSSPGISTTPGVYRNLTPPFYVLFTKNADNGGPGSTQNIDSGCTKFLFRIRSREGGGGGVFGHRVPS
jgi:hypothetical protein